MNPANKAFLDATRHHHTTLVNAMYMSHLDGHTRSELVRVMSEEFQPGYHTDLWCPPCVSDMVLAVYRRYDEWLAANPEPADAVEAVEAFEEPELVTNPIDDFAPEPFVVKANFPKQNPNHRRR